jgi:serine/threonine protein kinase
VSSVLGDLLAVPPVDILLDHTGVVKYVDFGAAKVSAKNQKSIAARSRMSKPNGSGAGGPGGSLVNSKLHICWLAFFLALLA